jgi:hypothetical protein
MRSQTHRSLNELGKLLNGVAGNCENIPENPFLWQVAAGRRRGS